MESSSALSLTSSFLVSLGCVLLFPACSPERFRYFGYNYQTVKLLSI